jgi:hypothetical protein
MSARGLKDEGVVGAAVVVIGAAALGLVFGIAVEAIGRKNGRPSMGQTTLKVAQRALQGFALGSVAASTFLGIAHYEEN